MKQLAALLVTGLFVLAACGGSDEGSVINTELSPSPSASADTGSTAPGGSTVIAPLILGAETLTGELIVGQSATFDLVNPGDWTLSADLPALVTLTPGGDQGGYTTIPGATALSTGTVVVTLQNTVTGETLAFTLTIK